MVTIKEFTCERCGNKFETTAKHAKYCPECREIKKLERIQAHKEKQKANESFSTTLREFTGVPGGDDSTLTGC